MDGLDWSPWCSSSFSSHTLHIHSFAIPPSPLHFWQALNDFYDIYLAYYVSLYLYNISSPFHAWYDCICRLHTIWHCISSSIAFEWNVLTRKSLMTWLASNIIVIEDSSGNLGYCFSYKRRYWDAYTTLVTLTSRFLGALSSTPLRMNRLSRRIRHACSACLHGLWLE